jgi:hypothetical protein
VIVFGVMLWAIFSGHPWVAVLMLTDFSVRLAYAVGILSRTGKA